MTKSFKNYDNNIWKMTKKQSTDKKQVFLKFIQPSESYPTNVTSSKRIQFNIEVAIKKSWTQ